MDFQSTKQQSNRRKRESKDKQLSFAEIDKNYKNNCKIFENITSNDNISVNDKILCYDIIINENTHLINKLKNID